MRSVPSIAARDSSCRVSPRASLASQVRYLVLMDTEKPSDPDATPLMEGHYAACREFVEQTPGTKLWFDTPDFHRFPSLTRQ